MCDPVDILGAKVLPRRRYPVIDNIADTLHDGEVVILDGMGAFRVKRLKNIDLPRLGCHMCDLYIGGCTNSYYGCSSHVDTIVAKALENVA